ncbi:T9SS type A sorting domain-containing protein [Fibrobacter sp. UWB12]|uniref:T9SS type A sorting domain-containing protein n=1 Tax=Fibrobacter sp. UWB12 TaxID=1896203 RepID=UPI000923D1B8|nr:T9SS type A sorting domain-containing protein [Fibrobacter sp. UWB12]SHK88732.1 Por secretion system C-terminal sorting domain-containing protein [Fibrobacter sp. UWB12]
MKYLNRLQVLTAVFLPMSVWAAPFGPITPDPDVYLNLCYGSDNTLYLEQSEVECVKNMPYSIDGISATLTCVASEKIGTSFYDVFNKVLRMSGDGFTSQYRWKSSGANATQMQSTVLKLASDIDLKGNWDAEGNSCSNPHDLLYFYGKTLDGQGHTISNFCRVDKGSMGQPFGLFGEISGRTIKNLNISNVTFTVTDKHTDLSPASTDAGDYQAAGALAPTIFSSIIENVKLKDISIQAPLAGGLAGFIEGSTVKHVFTDNGSNISITNDRQILDGYIGSTVYTESYPNSTVFKGYRYVSGVQEQYKVLLGGLAGASMFTTFQNINIAVQVKNNANVALSGLGGLVGHYVYARATSEPDVVFNDITIHGVDATTKLIVSGGTAMGGVLGATKRYAENNSIKVKLIFNNVHVDGLNMQNSKVYIKTPSNVHHDLYMGGIIGNSGLCGGGILEISESTVENISIDETLPGNATFQYFIGGVAGYASCENMNNFNDDVQGLTLKKTNANGSISLKGGKSSGSGGKVGLINRVSATIGGLVGAAVISVVEKAVTENNSSVSIDYNAKRVSSATEVDSVLVGGIFGAVSIFNTSIVEIGLTNLSYKGLISVFDDGVTSRIGGIIGKFPLLLSGDPRITFDDVHAESAGSKDLIKYTYKSGMTEETSLSMGGICGLCHSPRVVSGSTVKGNFVWDDEKSSSTTPEKETDVGGLIGLAQGKAVVSYEVKNNSFVGDMSAAFNKGTGRAGYLFGTMVGDGFGSQPQVISNFHYGSDNVGAVGYFNNYGEFRNVKYFNEDGFNKFVAKNNVRNATAENLQDGENGSTLNGTVTASYMKSKDFAAFLNGPWEDDDRVWTYGTTSDFPFLGTPAVFTFTVVFKDGDGAQIGEAQELSYGAAAVAPDAPVVAGKCFTGWSESFDKVTKSMEVVAQYKAGTCTYDVTFKDWNGNILEAVAEDGTPIPNPQQVEEGKSAIVPQGPKHSGNRCFLKWDDTDALNDYKNVTHGGIVVTALYKDCYEVFFYGMDGHLIVDLKTEDGKSLLNPQIIDKGKAATAPKEPEPTADGKCFAYWDEDFSNVTQKLLVKAQSKPCEYTVKFTYTKKDGTTGEKTEVVEYNKSATPPSADDVLQKTEDGKCFTEWDTDFTHVKGGLTVLPVYDACKYTVTFTYTKKNGTAGVKTEVVEYNKSATPPSTDDVLQKTEDGQCFSDWDKDFAHVMGDMTVAAQYETCKYTVKFYVINDKGVSELLGQDVVEHGKSATAPEAPAKMGDLCFETWAPGFSNVTNKLDVTAKYSACKSSSSSSDQQSSSSSSISSSSSSSENASESSSSSSVENGDKSSSSSVGNGSSSSAVNDKSSSSASDIFTVVAKPTAKQDGSALRMTINDTLPDSHAKVDYHIIVKSDVGTYLDTVVDGKTVGDVKNGTWSLDPAPAGEYKVLITLTNGKDSIVAYDSIFVGSTEKRVDLVSNTWQTYSLYAFCNDKGENCKNDLKDRFARKAEIRAIEECRQMKEDLARSPDDADLRESVDEVCREAIESQNEVATSVFWWDESSPIGDYWQYRRYDADDKFDSTRGYWYGSVDDEPLMLSLQTPNMKDEIVWKLENKYTGWNLVANPYGWYVKLPQNDDVVFKKWKADISDYDTVSILGPYEAVWAYTSKTREYRIPLKAAIVLEGEKKTKALSKSAMSESWNLRVVLTDKNGKRDYWNELAAGSVASSLSEPPAGMGDRVNLSIVEGKQRLAKSVKKNSDELEWNLEASATTTRDGKLNFEGLESVRAKGMHVFATIGEETFEVVNDRPLSVKLSSKAKNVSVRVTKSAVPAQVAKNLISGFRVNQMQNALNVGFEGVSKLAGAKVKVSVVGIDGRVVATSGTVAHEGTNSISMKKPKQGVYFVRLKVGSQSAVTRIMVR